MGRRRSMRRGRGKRESMEEQVEEKKEELD